MASKSDEIDKNVLNDLLIRITIMEQKNIQQQKTNVEMVKEIKKLIEERVRCAY